MTKYRYCNVVFEAEDRTVNKNLDHFKEYDSQRYWRNFRRKVGKWMTLLKKDSGNRKHRPKPREWQTEARAYWRELNRRTAVDELVLSQESQTQTHRYVRQTSRETGLTQCSIVQIIYRDVGLKCFVVYRNSCLLLLLVFRTFIFHKVV